MVFINGDVSDGSPNDLKLKGIIGPNWKKLANVDEPSETPLSSPGYRHDVYWPTVIERVAILQANEQRAQSSIAGAPAIVDEISSQADEH